MENNNQNLKSAIALLIGIVFALIISEVALQILDFPSRPVSGWLNCEEKNPGQCNSMGFRGREIVYSDEDFVVILLGDSEVYAANFPFEQMPERRLERFLRNYRENVKVFTIADMGYGQDQQYLALKKYFEKYRADLVLLMFTARNDVGNNMFPVTGGNSTIKPTFWIEDGDLRGPTERWLEHVGTRLKLKLLFGTYIGESYGELREEIWEKQVLSPPYQPLSEYHGKIDYSWQNDWDNGRREGISNALNEISGIGGLSPRSGRIQYGIDLTRKLFSEIKNIVELNNGHFIIFKEERNNKSIKSGREQVYLLNGKYYNRSSKQIQDNLKDLFRDFEHYRIPLNLENYRISENDSHLNDQAYNNLFEGLSKIISKQEYFIPPR